MAAISLSHQSLAAVKRNAKQSLSITQKLFCQNCRPARRFSGWFIRRPYSGLFSVKVAGGKEMQTIHYP
jgi:hypothetical protein